MFSCYKSLWIDKNFFQQFETDKFTSQQLNKVIQKSKLNHIRQLKQIYRGKNIKKNKEKIKMKITQANHVHGAMLQLFSISPKIKTGVVFIIDLHLHNIINSSYKGLKSIELHRCPYIKSFQAITKCSQLIKFIISYNQFITTQSFIPIVKRCQKIQHLQISECKNIDQNIFNQIKNITELKKITLKLFKQSFGHLNCLSYCEKLQELNIDDSLINDQQLMNGIRQLKKLKILSIQGCALLTDIAADFILIHIKKPIWNLRIVHISRMQKMSDEKIQQIRQNIFQLSLHRDE